MAREKGDQLFTAKTKMIGKQQLYAILVDAAGDPVLDAGGNVQAIELGANSEGRLQVSSQLETVIEAIPVDLQYHSLDDDPLPVKVADGDDVALGAKADTPITVADATPFSVIAILKGIWAKLAGTLNVSLSGRSESYIIPMLDLLAWSGFTNQPAGDGVEIVSDSASDVGKITIFGTTHVGGAFAYETVTLNGVTAVPTVKLDWGNIYGAFLGDIEGKNISPAVGTITIREASGDQAITTIVATKISKGMVVFDLTGKQIILNVHSGNAWKRCAGVVSATNGFKMNLTGGNIKEEKIVSMLYLISDTTGATAQIEVLA